MRTLNKTSSAANINLSWVNSIKISRFLVKENINYAELIKTYKIKIFDKNDILIKEYANFKDGDFSTDLVGLVLDASSSSRRAMMFASPRKLSTKVIDTMNYKFKFLFEENAQNYYDKNNKYGFFDKFKIHVISEDGDDSNDAEILIDYSKIEEAEINGILKKTYKNLEGNALKIKFNKTKFLDNKVEGMLFVPQTEAMKMHFKYIFVDEIQDKWVSIIENEASMTVPFPNLYISSIQESLVFDVYFLNKCQVEIFNFFKQKGAQDEDLLLIFQEYLSKQKLSLSNIQDEAEEFKVWYQNFIYLFNEESFQNISWPTELIKVHGIEYKKYYPQKKDIDNNETYVANLLPTIDASATATIEDPNIYNQNLGYKYKNLNNEIKDGYIEEDLASAGGLNIKSIEIKNIINNNNNISIYFEVVTNFINNLNFKVLNISNNISLVNKYYTYNEENNLTFLFKLDYAYSNNFHPNLLKKQLIQDRQFINFDLEII